VLAAFGRLPRRGEKTTIGDWQFEVLRADSRRVHLLRVTRAASVPEAADA
jgi:magnesium and cobalt transporter